MSDGERHILALNAGSSSLKLGLFDWETERQLAKGSVDWGRNTGARSRSHTDALRELLSGLDTAAIRAIGHRVVHGGAEYSHTVQIGAGVKAAIERLARLAPLHNPAALSGIEAAEAMLPGVPQVAAFDTAFHSRMPPSSFLYALPHSWYEEWGIRRFGFHGLSHAYCTLRAAEMLGQPLDRLKLVICHLGNGCSLAAVDGGRSVATTMGFTPLEGLMMGARSGAVDAGILFHLLGNGYLGVAELERVLNHESGLLGVSGLSRDMREILAARANGHHRAGLAFDLYTARIREAIGSMAAAIGGLDALVFTAGVGENSPEVREAVAGPLAWMGIEIDQVINARVSCDEDIAPTRSPVRALVIHTREDLMVARETRAVLEAQ